MTQISKLTLQLTDFLLWVLFTSTVTVITSGVTALIIWANLIAVKNALFAVGIVLFGIGSIGIQPERIRRRATNTRSAGATESSSGTRPQVSLGQFSVDTNAEYGFEQRIQTIPPLRDNRLSFGERISRDWKIFATSLLVLATSLYFEIGLDVHI
ncbi:hypothetical protein [Haloquadratum walsbyi]|jgi:hypothetical protein|uniref:Uncharacterized protein n=1 Tax=Haloquadratum walsbyi J07HQW2 TaxID=1238425 RepID=U1NGB6_9EURY|nr:hypothetical protein [Haloquadratum walsbyi]ERG96170.1 MAG: hypothetical protein J07HQW2_02640 [Haloquadratum walsbyi J07HQW2]